MLNAKHKGALDHADKDFREFKVKNVKEYQINLKKYKRIEAGIGKHSIRLQPRDFPTYSQEMSK
jgi:hypothetical protein